MADETVPVLYPNTIATGLSPEFQHAEDHNDETANRAVRER